MASKFWDVGGYGELVASECLGSENLNIPEDVGCQEEKKH